MKDEHAINSVPSALYQEEGNRRWELRCPLDMHPAQSVNVQHPMSSDVSAEYCSLEHRPVGNTDGTWREERNHSGVGQMLHANRAATNSILSGGIQLLTSQNTAHQNLACPSAASEDSSHQLRREILLNRPLACATSGSPMDPNRHELLVNKSICGTNQAPVDLYWDGNNESLSDCHSLISRQNQHRMIGDIAGTPTEERHFLAGKMLQADRTCSESILTDEAVLFSNSFGTQITSHQSLTCPFATSPDTFHQKRVGALSNQPLAYASSGSPTQPNRHGIQSDQPNQSVNQGPVELYMSCDEESLSDYQCLIRRQIELFTATSEEVGMTSRGRKKPLVLGRVGIRCKHCSSLPVSRRGCAAVYYPAKLQSVYQAAQNMATKHLCGSCQKIPKETRDRLIALAPVPKSSAGSGKKYWSDGARVLGVHETDTGLRFLDQH